MGLTGKDNLLLDEYMSPSSRHLKEDVDLWAVVEYKNNQIWYNNYYLYV